MTWRQSEEARSYLYSGQGHLRPERCRRRQAHGNQGDWLFRPHRSSPSATIGFNFSNGVTGIGFRSVDNRDDATRFTSGFVSAFNTGSATITGFALAAPEPRRRGLSGLAWDSWPPSQCDGLTARNTGVRSHLSGLRAAAKDHSGRIARFRRTAGPDPQAGVQGLAYRRRVRPERTSFEALAEPTRTDDSARPKCDCLRSPGAQAIRAGARLG